MDIQRCVTRSLFVVLVVVLALALVVAPQARAQSGDTIGAANAEAGQPPKSAIHRSARTYWIGVSLLVAAVAADAVTTERDLQRGNWEWNPLFGHRPSPARLFSEGAALVGGEVLAFRWTDHNRHAWIRWTGRAALSFAVVEHTRMAACNLRIKPTCPTW